MLVVGLTGGIGSGKSTVSDRFRQLGAPVIDADEVSRDLTQFNAPGYKLIVESFGYEVVNKSGDLDRKKLRKIIAKDPNKRELLEKILHPLIRQKMWDSLSTLDSPYAILVVPLLFETGQNERVDRVLVVDTPEELQIKRVLARDKSSREVIQGIMGAQLDRESRLIGADDIIENDGEIDALYAKVDELDCRYKGMSQSTAVKSSSPTPRPNIPGQVSLSAMPWVSIHDINQQEKTEDNTNPQGESIVFELPLNERVRTLLRLEGLFEEIDHHLEGNSVWDSRSAIKVIISILATLNRPDVKTDLIKELDRLNNVMNKFRHVKNVDLDRLNSYQKRLQEISKTLRAMNAPIGLAVRQDELISAIKQRETIPGGPSTFDLPAYAYWLNQDVELRRKDITGWLSEFNSLRTAVELILEIIRKSALPTTQSAEKGAYQLILDSTVNYQLIRVLLPKGSPYCAEVAGGRHRFGIRFAEANGTTRPNQTQATIEFKLYCCAI
ncbi:MAG: cell division protein ZapD [Gammaproteobacteria bacterium]|nr:cell division protein ZapD [Gammaproteobacteria bacterium]MDH5693988.1 cell division protein ZapD [Gammaproteobacteria bacterium]